VPALQRDLFGQGKVVAFRMFPVDQLDVFMGLAGRQQHLDRVAQQVIHPHVGLIEGIAAHLGGCLQLQQRGGDVLVGVAATAQVGAQELRLDAAVFLALAPVTEEAIPKAPFFDRCGEQLDHPVLGFTFRARYSVSHGILSYDGVSLILCVT